MQELCLAAHRHLANLGCHWGAVVLAFPVAKTWQRWKGHYLPKSSPQGAEASDLRQEDALAGGEDALEGSAEAKPAPPDGKVLGHHLHDSLHLQPGCVLCSENNLSCAICQG